MASTSITGANVARCRSFAISCPTGTGLAQVAIGAGGYYVVATTDSWVTLIKTGGAVAVVPGASQPAEASPNGLMFCPAGVPCPLDVDGSVAQFISTIAVSVAGTLNITGPLAEGRVS